MGKYTFVVLYVLSLQGVHKKVMPTHLCQLTPITMAEVSQRGAVTKVNNDLFHTLPSILGTWTKCGEIFPVEHKDKFLLWPNILTALHVGSTNLPRVTDIVDILGLAYPVLLRAFAIKTTLVTTFLIDGQYLDQALTDRLLAGISSTNPVISVIGGTMTTGLNILRLRPLDLSKLQKLEWTSYPGTEGENHLTLLSSTRRFLTKARRIRHLITHIYDLSFNFSRTMSWEKPPENFQAVSDTRTSFEWHILCHTRSGNDQPCDPVSANNNEVLVKAMNEVKAIKNNPGIPDHDQLDDALSLLTALKSHPKSLFNTFEGYAGVVASWENNVWRDPDNRKIPHIMDLSFDYDAWVRNFKVLMASPYRLTRTHGDERHPTRTKVSASTPNHGDADTFEMMLFLSNRAILQQFMTFLSQRRSRTYQELNTLQLLLMDIKLRDQQAIQSLLNQLAAGMDCKQGPHRVGCRAGPLRIKGSIQNIEVTGWHMAVVNKTYFSPVCDSLENGKGQVFSFVWDGEIFRRTQKHLVNSLHKMPLKCLLLQEGKIPRECKRYFPPRDSPRSAFLMGDNLVYESGNGSGICFRSNQDGGPVFDNRNTYVTTRGTSCLPRNRFPIHFDDRLYTFMELSRIIRNRINPRQQVKLHQDKWDQGLPLADIRLEVENAYDDIREFFSSTLHIWITIGLLTVSYTHLTLPTILLV